MTLAPALATSKAQPQRLGSAAQSGEPAALQRFMTFHLDGRTYGLPLRFVAEISPYRELNRMPHMPKAVEGLLDLRGRVIPVVNLRVRMGLPPLEGGKQGSILVLDLAGTPSALLVDSVDAVLSVEEEHLVPASPLLAGIEGAWVEGFIVEGEQVVAILDAALVASQGSTRGQPSREALATLSLEERLDADLRRLIELAPPKEEGQRVIPQIETSISYTEQEMAKVLDRVEAMLAGADRVFQGLGFLKQEVGLGRLKGHEKAVAELERTNQELQDTVFALIQQVQFQDIARQKLERVLNHLRGMQVAISGKLRAERKRG
ncbi:MAG TPA: chemotaxis protein CheW [Holophagaceae bacterium]